MIIALHTYAVYQMSNVATYNALCLAAEAAKEKHTKKKVKPTKKKKNYNLSEPGFDPGTCGLWAHHASATPL